VVAGAYALGAAGLLLTARSASAHFVLEAPASYDVVDPTTGLPEKLGPCGNEDPQMATNDVTTFEEGQSITITVNEVVFHPGHYRVALAMTADHMDSSFPAEPVPVEGSTNSGTMVCGDGLLMTPCGSVPIQDPPVFPVLADDLFEHCDMFGGPQSTTVKLPDGVTCDKCTLQVIEFMSEHGPNVPGGCFYHHCADISIRPKGSAADGGGSAQASGGTSASKSGGSCSASPSHGRWSGGALVGMVAAAAALQRRRRLARACARA
jgi:hypothetical protein